MSGHNETLFLELLGNITWAGAADFDPGLREHSAGGEHEDDVDQGVDRVQESLGDIERWGHVVGDSRGGKELSRAFLWFPNTEKTDEEVIRETGVKDLREEEDVGAESGLKHNWHVAGVEETDWVSSTSTTVAGGLDWDFDTESLEVDDGGENNEGSEEVHDVREILAVESLLESTLLVWPGKEEMEESDDSTLELRSTASVDSGRAESLPDDALANVGGDEERDTGSQSVALLEKFIEEDNNETGDDELDDQEDTDTGTEIARLTIKTSQDVDSGLSERQDDSEQFLGGLVQFTVRLQVEVNINHVGTSQELEDHAGRDNGCDSEFHQCTSITSQHHTEPV